VLIWRRNSKETLTQNYSRIGLVSKLNKRAGGVEKDATGEAQKESDSLAIARPTVLSRAVEIAEVELQRDPDTGKILGFLGDEHETRSNPLNDPLNDILEESEPEEWDAFGNVPPSTNTSQKPIVEALEQLAATGVRKPPRKQSEREEEWIEKLVKKYGDDYGMMVRDRKLNPMQQTKGDIRKRVLKWEKKQKAGASI
jgi:nucleolar protein 16